MRGKVIHKLLDEVQVHSVDGHSLHIVLINGACYAVAGEVWCALELPLDLQDSPGFQRTLHYRDVRGKLLRKLRAAGADIDEDARGARLLSEPGVQHSIGLVDNDEGRLPLLLDLTRIMQLINRAARADSHDKGTRVQPSAWL